MCFRISLNVIITIGVPHLRRRFLRQHLPQRRPSIHREFPPKREARQPGLSLPQPALLPLKVEAPRQEGVPELAPQRISPWRLPRGQSERWEAARGAVHPSLAIPSRHAGRNARGNIPWSRRGAAGRERLRAARNTKQTFSPAVHTCIMPSTATPRTASISAFVIG